VPPSGDNDALLRVCQEQHRECLDVAKTLPRDGGVFSDDTHFTERGSRLLADRSPRTCARRPPLRR